jgi:hypothetical protein
MATMTNKKPWLKNELRFFAVVGCWILIVFILGYATKIAFSS